MAADKSRFMCGFSVPLSISAGVLVFTQNLPTAAATKKGATNKDGVSLIRTSIFGANV
jgi:hypothetical protein